MTMASKVEIQGDLPSQECLRMLKLRSIAKSTRLTDQENQERRSASFTSLISFSESKRSLKGRGT
jgi:hypothetical protein